MKNYLSRLLPFCSLLAPPMKFSKRNRHCSICHLSMARKILLFCTISFRLIKVRLPKKTSGVIKQIIVIYLKRAGEQTKKKQIGKSHHPIETTAKWNEQKTNKMPSSKLLENFFFRHNLFFIWFGYRAKSFVFIRMYVLPPSSEFRFSRIRTRGASQAKTTIRIIELILNINIAR